MKTRTDALGRSHTDYYMGSQRVFADVQNHQGDRTRTSYDMNGSVQGKRTDFGDGHSVSQFTTPFGSFRVLRNQGELVVEKEQSGEWTAVQDQNYCTDILRAEKHIFTPPHVVGRGI